MQCRRGVIGVFLLALSNFAYAANVAVPASYSWKSGEIYRFEYSKTVTSVQPNENNAPEERTSEISGFLILEIKTASATSATALMRIDSPHVKLPEIYFFSSQFDQPQLQKDKHRTVAKALEGAIKSARWNVTLDNNGVIHFESRQPAKIDDWMAETLIAAGWRQKNLPIVYSILENDFGLKATGDDSEMLLCLGNSPAQTAGAATDMLHPIRSAVVATGNDLEKVQLSFKRVAPSKAGSAYVIPGTDKLNVTLNSVVTDEATAVFDPKLSMVDSLNEKYTAELGYTFGADKMVQTVHVHYKLKRLAPIIAVPE